MTKLSLKHVAVALLCLMLHITPLAANQVTGTLSTPNTSVAVGNGTLTFTLSQAAIVSGSYALSTTPVTCRTDTDGGIVALPNPTTAPTGSISLASGTLSAGTYYVKYSYYDSVGETRASPVASFVLSGAGTLTVDSPLTITGATGWNAYISTVQGSETLQEAIVGFTAKTQSADISAGAALPSDNDTQCDLTFNDALIPSDTTYAVTLVDSNSAAVPGFPQNWYLAGSSYDVTNGFPISNNRRARFPLPIIANPSSNATQSVNSPLTLNSYGLAAAYVETANNASPPAAASGRTYRYNDSNGDAVALLGADDDQAEVIFGPSGMRTRSYAASTTVSSSAGATLTATNLIPVGCVLLGVDTRILTAFGATNGLTSFELGDGSDADRFGTTLPIVVDSTTDNSDSTIASVPLYPAATSIVLTGNGDGGNEFDGDGLIRITAHCMDVVAAIQ